MDPQPSNEWPETATSAALCALMLEELQDIRKLRPGRARASQALTVQIMLNRMQLRGWITAADAAPLVDVLKAMKAEQEAAENTAAGVPPLPAGNGGLKLRAVLPLGTAALPDTTPSCC